MGIKTKKGAASFYVVAFSTLILLIVAASFTALVISQITRSSNDDLSRSAYDSAMAGVEDAKLAFYNYQNCLAQGNVAVAPSSDKTRGFTCGEIIWLMENNSKENASDPSANCDVIAKILGRDITAGGVQIKESHSENNMQQSYTCVKVTSLLKDYRATLSSANSLKVIQARFDDGVDASLIKKIKISWGASIGSKDVGSASYYSSSSNRVSFPSSSDESQMPNPSAIGLALVQASSEYKMSDFERTAGDRTNSGHIYLVPIGDSQSTGSEWNYRKTNGGYDNIIDKSGFLDSNRKTAVNLPYGVQCHKTTTGDDAAADGEFACRATVELPEPIGGARANDNFVIAVSLPYGRATDFALEFFCDEGKVCGKEETVLGEGGSGTADTNQASLKGVQIAVDSTGKANDLFRRVETRLEGTDSFAISLLGPLELFGQSSGGGDNYNLKKDMAVTCEYDFAPTCPRDGE